MSTTSWFLTSTRSCFCSILTHFVLLKDKAFITQYVKAEHVYFGTHINEHIVEFQD